MLSGLHACKFHALQPIFMYYVVSSGCAIPHFLIHWVKISLIGLCYSKAEFHGMELNVIRKFC